MNSVDPRPLPFQSGQIAAFALALGVVLMTGVSLVVRATNPPAVPQGASTSLQNAEQLLFVLAAIVPAGILGAFIVRATQTSAARRSRSDGASAAKASAASNPYSAAGLREFDAADPEVRRLTTRFVMMSIICLVMIESGGLLGAVVYLLAGNPLALAAPGLSLMFMAVFFPSRSRLRAFLQDTLRD